MQNKGFVRVFAVLLTLVCIFYLSFSFVTAHYYNKAEEYAAGDPMKESIYLDSLSTKKVWLGYTLKKARTMELNLGLDLKGGMNVVMEISIPDVLKSISGNNPDPNFNQALEIAKSRQFKEQKDFISLFIEEFHRLDPGAKLSAIFSTFETKDKITPQSSDNEVEAYLRSELNSAIDNSFNVLRTRIDRFGVVAPNIQKMESDGRILIELPGIKEPERVRKLLQGSANLEFWETYDLVEIYEPLLAINAALGETGSTQPKDSTEAVSSEEPATEVETAENQSETTTEADTAKSVTDELLAGLAGDSTKIDSLEAQQSFDEWKKENPLFAVLSISQYNGRLGQGPAVGVSNYKDTALVNSYLTSRQARELLPRDVVFRWTVKAMDEAEQFYQLIAIKTNREGKAPLEGDVITDANAQFAQYSSASEVSMSMNQEGAKIWARLTKENIGKSIAIILDDHVYSYPTVNAEITGGNSSISGNFTPEEAKDLANVLKSGKMSAPARIVQEDIIGPSLGQEAISEGFISFLAAFIVLMIYMMVVYGVKPGMIANAALILNLFFTMGILASFQAVLTLSGIAGIVLALAMAVDANVLIYERIKEEIRGGKNVKKAVEEGYKKAFSAIFDSNLTSIITGAILFYFGTGPIRGFATTLIIGIAISFFTAVFLTRLVYSSFLEKGKFQNLTFSTSLTKNFLVNPTYKFIQMKKISYIVSIAIFVIGMAFLGVRGLNQGIDFTGGRNYVVRFDQPVNTAEVRQMIDPQFEEDTPSVITIGTSDQVRISTNYKIEDASEGIDDEIITKLYEGLKPLLKEGTSRDQFFSNYVMSSQKVGPSIADDIKTAAYWAVIFSIIAIGLYILLRFRDVSYSVSTIVSLIQDAAFILGMYAIFWGILPFSMEVDQTFIGAVLTALGYSVNDKVVIFDRVREFTKLYPKRDRLSVFNESLNSTLDRTFNTSMSTLLVLIIIFIFAGDTIRSFSFAMILGVVMGTLSSLFVAAPMAYDMQTRKKKSKE